MCINSLELFQTSSFSPCPGRLWSRPSLLLEGIGGRLKAMPTRADLIPERHADHKENTP